jgi:hypothetical protein
MDLETARNVAKEFLKVKQEESNKPDEELLKYFLEGATQLGKNNNSLEERLRNTLNEKKIILLKEEPYEDTEKYYVFGYSYWKETQTGLEEVLMAGYGPLIVEKETSYVFALGSGHLQTEDGSIEFIYKEIKSAFAGLNPTWSKRQACSWFCSGTGRHFHSDFD